VKKIHFFVFLFFLTVFLPLVLLSATPFDEDKEIAIKNSAVEIQDIDTAEVAEMQIKKGFPTSGVVSVGNSNLRMRSWPWGDVVGKYPTGTAVKVIGESGEFFLVEVNGRQGYMHRNYVSVAGETASETAPYYPGNTASGGALSLKEGVKASKEGAKGKTTIVAASSSKKSSTSSSSKSSSKSSSTSSSSSSSKSSASKVTTGSNGKVVINVPKKCQMKVNCPAPGSACGPTSLAMILSYYTGKNVDSLATDLWKVCGSTKSSGTGHAGLKKGAKKYGYPNAKWHYCVAQSWVRQQLKAGKPILAHVKGHYVVIKGIDNSGRIYMNDPARSAVERSMSFSEFSAWWRGAGSKHPCMVLE
jgi:hypothetical protein